MNVNASKNYPAHVEALEDRIDPNSSLARIAELAGTGKRVLDIGCATGYLARLLSKQDCTVVGIDINAEAVEAAREHCEQAICADVEAAPLSTLVSEKSFDVVVCGDVLEHLTNPGRLLEEIRSVLDDDGYVVASFPNVAHGAVRLALVNGQFDYQEEGLLDDTHLRFFTLKSVDELLLGAGYRIDALERSKMDIFDGAHVLPRLDRRAFETQIVQRVEADPEARTLQFVVKATPLSERARLRAVFKRFSEVNTQLAVARSTVQAQERELNQLREHAAAFADRLAQLEGAAEKSAALQLEAAHLQERLRLSEERVVTLRTFYEERMSGMSEVFAARLEAEAAKTQAQADQIAAYIAFGSGKTS